MTKEKTAVDWLIEQLTVVHIDMSDEEWFGIMGEAKAIEKQQIVDAADHQTAISGLSGDEYYQNKFEQ